ncbi:hypothetical protein ACHAXT_001396 [Thalassiosira profunda]
MGRSSKRLQGQARKARKASLIAAKEQEEAPNALPPAPVPEIDWVHGHGFPPPVKRAVITCFSSDCECLHGCPESLERDAFSSLAFFVDWQLMSAAKEDCRDESFPSFCWYLLGGLHTNRASIAKVSSDANKRSQFIDTLLSLGTFYLLKEVERQEVGSIDVESVSHLTTMAAGLALAIEILSMNHNWPSVLKSFVEGDDAKIEGIRDDCELGFRDFHSNLLRESVSFYAKRTTGCKCLRKVYKELKLQPKLGICRGCERIMECREIFLCSGQAVSGGSVADAPTILPPDVSTCEEGKATRGGS